MNLERADKQHETQIHQLFCVPQVYEFLADGAEPPPSVAADWLAGAGADARNHGGGLWVLQDGSPASVVGLARLAGDEKGELELTYMLHPSLWGKGLATRMAHTVMAAAFKAGRADTIWAGADAPNTASIAVMERLGMRFRRDVEYPMGKGVEYTMQRNRFRPDSFETLPMK